MKNLNIAIKSFLFITALAGVLTACTDDSDSSVTPGTTVTPNEEELITTVQIRISDSLTAQVVDTVEFNDLDGPGGNAPTIDSIKLSPNRVYIVETSFFDASDPSDIEDITAEIEAEDDEHLVCFELMNAGGFSIEITDSDGTYPIGLDSKWKSGGLANGELKLTLRHQPGVKDGTCTPGETDVEVRFPLTIQ